MFSDSCPVLLAIYILTVKLLHLGRTKHITARILSKESQYDNQMKRI